MCFSIATATLAVLEYGKKRKASQAHAIAQSISNIGSELKSYFFVSAFEHPKVLCFTNEYPLKAQTLNWGLIPYWVHNNNTANKIIKQTLNARVESIFDKKSFKKSALEKRCLIYIDGYFEYFHFKAKTYPHFIYIKNLEPMILAGLWDNYTDTKTNRIIKTFTVVTTKANTKLEKIHNNPKRNEARMPIILTPENQDYWLNHCNNFKKIEPILNSQENINLNFHSVSQLTGNNGTGNTPLANKKFKYNELENVL